MGLTAGGLTFYEDQFETGVWFGLTQNLNVFNQFSGNTIVLQGGARKGRKPENTFYDDIAGLVQRRDPSGTGTLTPAVLADSAHRSIKLFRSAPLELTRQAFIDRGFDTPDGTRLYGQQLGEQMRLNFLNTGISALVGALTAVGSNAIHDISTTPGEAGVISHGVLNTALGKFGDARQNIRSLVTHSVPLTTLVGGAIASQAIAFQMGGVAIMNGMVPTFNLQTVITDSPALEVDIAPSTSETDYSTLLLVPGALTVKTGLSNAVFSFITGASGATPENQKWLLSTEWEFEITIKGVSYKSGSADNPTDAALASSANWDFPMSSHKLGPGILLKTDA